MKFQVFQKTYSGNYPRPSVIVEKFESEGLVIVSTPWGSRDAHKLMTQTIRDCYLASLSDPEATSPFARLDTLSSHANFLRAAVLLANDMIFERYNKAQYSSACEALVMAVNETELNWIQIGQPHLLLLRANEIQALQTVPDLAIQYANPTPLPDKLLGIDRRLELETRSFLLEPPDRLLVLGRSTLPKSLFTFNYASSDIETQGRDLFDSVVKENEKIPFWLGFIEILTNKI